MIHSFDVPAMPECAVIEGTDCSLFWDGGDPWGSAMAVGFALGDVSRAIEGGEEIARVLDYSPGMAPRQTLEELADGDEDGSCEAQAIATALLAGYLSARDLIESARILSDYLDALKGAGLDY